MASSGAEKCGIIQRLPALQYLVRLRRIPAYMGEVADKKIDQPSAYGGAGPFPLRRIDRN
jgi:hypothetical protein